MAKCSLCLKSKGTRKCLHAVGTVCSSCCGASRSRDNCLECFYFKPEQEQRRHSQVPYFTTHEMAEKTELQDMGDVIDGAICAFDAAHDRRTRDALYLTLMERLMDRYHFGVERLEPGESLDAERFAWIEAAIDRDLPGVESEAPVMIAGAVSQSIGRRTRGGREYLDSIWKHVEVRIGAGARVLSGERFLRTNS
jgi:hypothetical protein